MADHRSRSRSPPPVRDRSSRQRSRSPRRREDRDRRDRPRGSGGFKWKEKRTKEDREGPDRRLERGYRNRSPSPRREQPQESKGASVEDKFGPSKHTKENQTPRQENSEASKDVTTEDNLRVSEKFGKGASVEDKFGKGASVEDKFGTADKFGLNKTAGQKVNDEPLKRTAAPASSSYQEPTIRVFVNDRLGTRAEIPCLGSDLIRDFKALVAMRIGRRPHEIMLKRQGERPFKDHITLGDYGVSDGVQLDLEIDTGE
jgi:hypothetical protein